MKNGLRNSDFKSLRIIIKMIKMSPKDVMLLIGGIFVSMLVTFAKPQIVSCLTDSGLITKNFTVIVIGCIALVVNSIFEYGNELLQIRMFARVKNQFEKDLYQISLDRILRAPYSYLKGRTTAELFHTVSNDINSVAHIFSRSNLLTLQFLFQMMGGIVGVLILEWKVALLLLVVLPIKQAGINYLAKKKTKLTEKYISEQQQFSAWFGRQTRGVVEIKLWNLYRKKNNEFLERYKDIPPISEGMEMCDGIENALGMATDATLEILIYLICGFLLCKNKLTVGNIVAFITYIAYISGPMEVVLGIPYTWARINPSVTRLLELLDWPEEKLEINEKLEFRKLSKETADNRLEKDLNHATFNLKLENVCYSYDDTHEVLKDICLDIRAGRRIAIVGENGSGKTTLMSVILGILPLCDGTISLGDVNMSEVGLSEWRRHFAVVGQKPYLFDGSIKDNIDLNGEYSKRQLQDKMEEHELLFCGVGIHQEINSGIEWKVVDDGANLSGGEKQKIAFLRACVKKSEVLILDEVFSNCDEESRKVIKREMLNPSLNKTVIIISHYQEDIKDVDEVYELKDGELTKKVML